MYNNNQIVFHRYPLRFENIEEQIHNPYFKQLELDQQRQQKEAEKVVQYQDNNIIFNIKSLKHKKKQPKQIDISQINVKGDKNND